MAAPWTFFRTISGPYHLATYFLVCQDTGEAAVIDPGGPTTDLAAFAAEKGIRPVALLMTHGHADQFFSLSQFKATWDVPYCIHMADAEFFSDPEVQAKTLKAVGLPPPYPADRILAHGDTLAFGRQQIRVIHTPGHTPGSCCFFCQNHLFSGDTLFVGEAGRTDLPGGDLNLMIQSIRDHILPLDPSTHILPAHHHEGTALASTLAREMKENIYITDFILDP